MSRTARVAASSGHALIRFGGADYDCAPGETVLDALLRHGLALAHSCRKGVCLSCALRAPDGSVPAEAQAGLRPTLAAQGYFLSCLFAPESDVSVAACDDALFGRARVTSVDHIGPIVARVRLDPATPLHYRAGQFINLRRSDGVTRSYSLASVPGLDRDLELHAKRLPGGVMSNWIHDQLQPGDDVDIGGPNGASYYLSGRPEQSMLLVGNGTGLAPLYGIAREALRDGHSGPIHLYHGTRHVQNLYLDRELRAVARRHANFHYAGCLSGPEVPEDRRGGRAEACAFADHPDLNGWRVFLCGYPPMVEAAKKTAYLAGAALADIHADPFELREQRRQQRTPK